MKNNKGFTLIELLAVVLILGTIALIAIPTVNSVIEQSRKGAFETGVNNIIGSIESKCTSELIDGSKITDTYIFTETGVEPSLDVKGSLPTSGTAKVNDKCEVEINVSKKNYIIVKNFEQDEPVTYTTESVGMTYVPATEDDTFIGILYMNPADINAECNSDLAVSTTGTKSGCMKWYIYDKNEDGSYDAILDHSTTPNVSWAKEITYSKENNIWISINGPDNIIEVLKENTDSWTAVPYGKEVYTINQNYNRYSIDYTMYRARMLTYAEVNKIVGKNNDDYATERFNLVNLNNSQAYSSDGPSKYYWLYDNLAWVKSVGARINDDEERNGKYNNGYWLGTSVTNSTGGVWEISNAMVELGSSSTYGGYYGLRPVITIPGYYID